MSTLEDAARIAMDLPGVSEGERFGNRDWLVAKLVFAWERPFSKADIKRFGDETPPAGPILALRVEDLGEKEALLANAHDGFSPLLISTATPRSWSNCSGRSDVSCERRSSTHGWCVPRTNSLSNISPADRRSGLGESSHGGNRP